MSNPFPKRVCNREGKIEQANDVFIEIPTTFVIRKSKCFLILQKLKIKKMKTIRTFIKIAIVSMFCIATMASCSELSLSETELKFPAAFFEAGSFVVKTDLNWEIVEQPAWVKTGKIEENGRTIVEVTPRENHSFNSRMGKIKIQTAEKYYIVDIFQEGVHLKKESGDLGLSVEWNTCNLGATKSTDYGNYYTWNEIHDYQSNGYRLPTREEQEELINNCYWAWGENNGIEGARLKAIEFAENNNKKYMEILNR